MSTGTLIKLGGNLEDPRNAKPSDFPAVGPSGSAGESSGAGKLVSQNETQTGPRHTQDGGEGKPSVWGKDGEFKVVVNKGEGAGQSSVKCDWSVDLESGQMIPNAVTKY